MRDLNRDKEICDNATAGKWRVEISPSWGEYDNVEVFCDDDLVADIYFVNVADQEERINNAAFIVAAREGWPAAIDRAIAAEAEVSKLKEATVDMRDKVLFERERREKAEAEVERLRGQVEKMKCCPNCKKYNYCCGTWEDNVCGSWTMREGEE